MTEEEFHTVGFGTCLYSDRFGEARIVIETVRSKRGKEAKEIRTRNAFLVGRVGYHEDWLDVYPEDMAHWKVFTTIQNVENKNLREKMMRYEIETLKFALYQIAPDFMASLNVSNFIIYNHD